MLFRSGNACRATIASSAIESTIAIVAFPADATAVATSATAFVTTATAFIAACDATTSSIASEFFDKLFSAQSLKKISIDSITEMLFIK